MVEREQNESTLNGLLDDVVLSENFSTIFLKFMMNDKAFSYTPKALLDFDRFILRCEYNGRSCMNVSE